MTKELRPSDAALAVAAQRLGCSESMVRAVADVEAPYGAFMPSGLPTMLFERHVFNRLTGGRFTNATAPTKGEHGVPSICALIASPSPGGYGPFWAQPNRLDAASKLDRTHALMATSWGCFQILGENYRLAGHATLQSFVNAMYEDVDQHLAAFIAFIESDHRLLAAMRDGDCETFAGVYNGRRAAVNDYAGRLLRARSHYESPVAGLDG